MDESGSIHEQAEYSERYTKLGENGKRLTSDRRTSTDNARKTSLPDSGQKQQTSLPDTPTGKKTSLQPIDHKEKDRKGALPPITAASGDFSLSKDYLQPRLDSHSPALTPSEGSLAGSSLISDLSRNQYEAESPDELALVKAACTYGCCLLKRSPDKVTVWLPGMWCL